MRYWAILLLSCGCTGLLAAAGASPTSGTVPSVRPNWTVGDWWVVESQTYDHGDRKPGATPGWTDKETWQFSVVTTNAIDGEDCYQVSIQPKEGNHCPYWFSCWFRMSDLLVLRREMHQPAATRTGRPFPVAAVQANYSKDEEMPFMPSDFPGLPLTTPHFSGGSSNVYGAKIPVARQSSSPTGTLRKSLRSSTGRLTQSFHQNEQMEHEQHLAPNLARTAALSGAPERVGVIVLAQSAERYERQNWSSHLPWHAYGEKWEGSQLVRKSWLADWGHSSGSPAEPTAGGAK